MRLPIIALCAATVAFGPAIAVAAPEERPASALSSSAPHSHLPYPQHTERGTVEVSDIEDYVNLMFSDQNRGIYRKRDRKIHKFTPPITIHFNWPKCEAEAAGIVKSIAEATDIEMKVEFGSSYGNNINFDITGVGSKEDIINNKSLYNFLEKEAFIENKIFKNILDNIDTVDKIFTQTQFSIVSGEITFIEHIFNKNAILDDTCYLSINNLIVPFLSNAYLKHYHDYTYLNLLYTSALYDSSVLNGEDEATARPKILSLMISKHERNK